MISNDSVPAGLDVSIDQCVSITGGIPDEFAADIHPDNITPLSPSGMRQPLHTGQGYVLFNFYASPRPAEVLPQAISSSSEPTAETNGSR